MRWVNSEWGTVGELDSAKRGNHYGNYRQEASTVAVRTNTWRWGVRAKGVAETKTTYGRIAREGIQGH